MKHLWFGAGLLAVLLAVSLLLGGCLENTHHIPAKDLDRAAEAAVNADWSLASDLYLRAEMHWQEHRDLTAALAHHSPIEEIDSGFALLENYIRCRETASFASACSQLAQQLRSLPRVHGFSWWNLL